MARSLLLPKITIAVPNIFWIQKIKLFIIRLRDYLSKKVVEPVVTAK